MNESKLELTKEEKESILLHLWENMFDIGSDDVHYIDPPMVKLLNYLGVEVPNLTNVTDCYGDEYTIEIVANQ